MLVESRTLPSEYIGHDTAEREAEELGNRTDSKWNTHFKIKVLQKSIVLNSIFLNYSY